ncbi:hypothetical protein D3C81_1196400 [compost metagenome]
MNYEIRGHIVIREGAGYVLAFFNAFSEVSAIIVGCEDRDWFAITFEGQPDRFCEATGGCFHVRQIVFNDAEFTCDATGLDDCVLSVFQIITR